LWVVTLASVIALGMTLRSRDAIAAAGNRVNQVRASWLADGCVARVRTELARIESDPVRSAAAWMRLDSAIGTPVWTRECGMTLRPAGMSLDVNSADEERLQRFFRALGAPPASADSLSDALLDWRDADDAVRASGAERTWYVARHLRPPRNAPLAAAGELRFVRGFAQMPELDSLLDVEPTRLFVGRAPLAVLASLPGVNGETLTRIAMHRAMGHDVPEWAQLAAEVSPIERVELMRNLMELVRRSTSAPDAWLVDLTVAVGHPAIASTRRVRLVKLGAASIVVTPLARSP
jgi:type II secretory pathway component PulK